MPDLIDSARITLTCGGCGTTIHPDPRHLENLTAAGAWTCTICQSEAPR